MAIVTRTKQGVTILDVDGKLTAGGGIALQQTVQGLLDRGVRRILINMDGVDLMDSSGLGELVAADKASRSAGAAFGLCQASAGVRRTLSVVRLTGAFRVFDDEPSALAALRS